MSRRLPPLNALLAFEAAARHLSFTRAARELHVTQAAISHQVKALEEYLGLQLFRRHPRALFLTDAGQLYLGAVRDAFNRLDEATRRLLHPHAPQTLTVSIVPSFAARWLVPRLGRFQKLHPHIDVRVSTSSELVDFAREDVDIAVRFGRGRYPGLRCDFLMTTQIFPVCSPALLSGPHPLREPGDLRHHVLLHDETHDDWRTWLKAAGAADVDPERGPVFMDCSMMVQAAVAGQGVGLARSAIAVDELSAGHLVRLFSLDLPVRGHAYYVVCPEGTAERPKIRAFREWLLAEAAAGDAPGAARDQPPGSTPPAAAPREGGGAPPAPAPARPR